MSRKIIRLLAVALVFALVGIGAAQAQDNGTAVAELPAYVPPMSLPPSARLTGLRPVYQLLNRCSAAALTIELSYYGWTGTYDDTIHFLNPSIDDVAVRLDEMITFANMQGLQAVDRVGGTLDLLRALVANGFPVLIENVYYDGPSATNDWMSHNRVIMGYDDAKQELYSFDSLLGNGPDNTGRPIPYADIDKRWRDFNRDYLVVYRADEADKLKQVMGNFWDANYAAQYALQQSNDELNNGVYFDGFTLFNKGESLVLLGRYDEAAAAFDRARGMGLPWRMMWYQYGPFEAYYHVGRYDDMIKLADDVLSTTHGVEEMYYYLGLAYEAQGNTARAKAQFRGSRCITIKISRPPKTNWRNWAGDRTAAGSKPTAVKSSHLKTLIASCLTSPLNPLSM